MEFDLEAVAKKSGMPIRNHVLHVQLKKQQDLGSELLAEARLSLTQLKVMCGYEAWVPLPIKHQTVRRLFEHIACPTVLMPDI